MSQTERFYCIRFCPARHYLHCFFPVLRPHSLLYPVQLRSMGSLLKISVRIRAGQITTTNQICGVSKPPHVLVPPVFRCRSDVFVTKRSKMLFRILSDPMLTKSALLHAGMNPAASGMSWGSIQDMAAAGACVGHTRPSRRPIPWPCSVVAFGRRMLAPAPLCPVTEGSLWQPSSCRATPAKALSPLDHPRVSLA